MNRSELKGKEVQYFVEKDEDDQPVIKTCKVLDVLETGVILDTMSEGAFYNRVVSFDNILAVITPVDFTEPKEAK